MKKKRRILSTFLAACMVTTCMAGMSVPASAVPVTESTYSITIPSTLTVANSGWNSIGNISATGTLASGKKLTVSAESANSWVLKSGANSVSYTLKNASTDNAATTSWEFTSLPTSQAIGIDVADYSSKPAGTYTDTVTFTAKVESAAITVTINQSDWGNGYSGSFTKDGVTVSAEIIDSQDGNLMGGGTFSTTLGNFTKIVVTTFSCFASGTGWSGSGSSMTWAGTPASTVSFSGEFMGRGRTQTTIVCTIEPTN